MKGRMKISAILLVIALAVTSICHVDSNIVDAATKPAKVGNGIYTITSKKKKEARFDRLSKKSIKSLSIPATVKIGKVKYKVVSVKANALAKTKIKKLVIGKNVRKIGKKAFYNCKSLKSITIKSKKLTSVGKKAFGKLNSRVVVTLPKLSDSKVKAYEKMLRGGGLTGKNQVIKPNKPIPSASPEKPVVIPDPKVGLRIGPMQKGYKWDEHTTTSSVCAIGGGQELNIRVDIPTEMYGYWSTDHMRSDYKATCTVCQLVVSSKKDRLVHGLQTGHEGYTIRTKGDSAFDASVWHPDDTPCNLVYQITLPEGMEIEKESISINQLSRRDTLLSAITSDNYAVSIDGRNLTVRTEDIKSGGFCTANSGDVRYLPIVASFSAKLSESAAVANTVNASVSYSCGANSKTLQTNTVTINKLIL